LFEEQTTPPPTMKQPTTPLPHSQEQTEPTPSDFFSTNENNFDEKKEPVETPNKLTKFFNKYMNRK
jgi:hypothetical protein